MTSKPNTQGEIISFFDHQLETLLPAVEKYYEDHGRGIVVIKWDNIEESDSGEFRMPLEYHWLDAIEKREAELGTPAPFGIKDLVIEYNPDTEIAIWVTGKSTNIVFKIAKKPYAMD